MSKRVSYSDDLTYFNSQSNEQVTAPYREWLQYEIPSVHKAAFCFLRAVTAKYSKPDPEKLKFATKFYMENEEEFTSFVNDKFNPVDGSNVLSYAQFNAGTLGDNNEVSITD
jgi:hypothetical protein